MANELIIPLGDNVTLKVRDEGIEYSFDHHWMCPLTALIILGCSILILITVLAVYLSKSQIKYSSSKLTTLIHLLAITTYCECLLGRCISLLFAIVYQYKPPHFLCRISAASSVFAVIMESLCIGCIAVPKIFRTALRLWLLLLLAIALTIPIFVMPSSINARYIFTRNTCEIVGTYYTVAITVIIFIPSWLAMLYFFVSYRCNICPSNYMGIGELRSNDGRFVGILILLYILLVIPNIITIIINGLIRYDESNVIDGTKFDSVTIWLICLFWFSWPCLILYMYPAIRSAFKSLVLDCRRARSFKNNRNLYSDRSTPVLMATSDGLFLRNFGIEKQIDLTLISDISSDSSKQTIRQSKNVQPEIGQAPNRKMVRFAFHVTHIPEASNVYHSLPTYHSSSSSSSL